jgi:hypothetical protein
VIHTFYDASPERSTEGGRFGIGAGSSYTSISGGLTGNALFYPPFAYDQTNSQNLAFGTDRVNLDAAQGTGGWPVKVALPGISGLVSAVSYVNSNLIYAGTTSGQVYRLAKAGAAWTASAIHAAPLPSRWIWDVSPLPGDVNTVIAVMAGFGTPHVWRGAVAPAGTSATWSDNSGTAPNRVPDIPVNALCIEPADGNTMYVGTDVGVFRTTDGGVNWQPFSDGLPNTAVYDLKLHAATRLLRAGTHGRGLWERKLDVQSTTDVDLYVRDHVMATGRVIPTPSPVTATFADPLQGVSVGDALWWFMCADVKIDAPSAVTHTFQLPVAAVDYRAFETQLAHRDPQRGVTNRVYVQVHNRGIRAAANVTVKILYADASPGLPDLPADFWTAFPGTGTTTNWQPIGSAQTIATVSPTRPEILEWDWVPPATAAQHSCLLVVMDCPDDPIPVANKVFNIAALVTNEKRVGLRNLHVIDALGPAPIWSAVRLHRVRKSDVIRFGPPPAGWTCGVLLPKAATAGLGVDGLKAASLTAAQVKALKTATGDAFGQYDPAKFLAFVAGSEGATITKIPETAKGYDVQLLFVPRSGAAAGALTLTLEVEQQVVGGNTFVMRPAAAE